MASLSPLRPIFSLAAAIAGNLLTILVMVFIIRWAGLSNFFKHPSPTGVFHISRKILTGHRVQVLRLLSGVNKSHELIKVQKLLVLIFLFTNLTIGFAIRFQFRLEVWNFQPWPRRSQFSDKDIFRPVGLLRIRLRVRQNP